MPEDIPLLPGTLDPVILAAKYHELTAAGKRQLGRETRSRARLVDVVRMALESSCPS